MCFIWLSDVPAYYKSLVSFNILMTSEVECDTDRYSTIENVTLKFLGGNYPQCPPLLVLCTGLPLSLPSGQFLLKREESWVLTWGFNNSKRVQRVKRSQKCRLPWRKCWNDISVDIKEHHICQYFSPKTKLKAFLFQNRPSPYYNIVILLKWTGICM